MSETYNYCHVVGRTDVGRRRAANEDNMYNAVTRNGLVSIVCDGMGGHVGGATASRIAVSTIIENLDNVYYDDPRIAIGESIDKANKAIIQKTVEQPDLTGMGSTCVMLLVRAGKVYIGHVGDSRIYLVRSKKIVQLTKDHSYVQMLVDLGEITKEQAEHHPRKNEITNALGIPNMSPATVADDAIIPEAGDCFVLCSDGLSGMVSDASICKVISRQAEMTAQDRVDRLVAMANENGGVDNITVQLVEFSVSPDVVADEKKFPVWAKAACGAAAVLAVCAGVYFGVIRKPNQEADGSDDHRAEQTANTRAVIPIGSVTFKENNKIVEFQFTESTLKFVIGDDVAYTENVSFDPLTMEIKSETDAITKSVTGDNSKIWLSFTDKFPGEKIEISLTTSDKKEVYPYVIDIKAAGKGGLSIPKEQLQGQQDPQEEEPAADEVKEEKVMPNVEPIPVNFEYDKLEKGTRLILNYSANPSIIFNGVGQKIESNRIDKILEGVVCDDLYWSKESKRGQFSLIYKGESSNKEYVIEIPCQLKGSEDQVVIKVTLTPKPVVEEEGDASEDEKVADDDSADDSADDSTVEDADAKGQEETGDLVTA